VIVTSDNVISLRTPHDQAKSTSGNDSAQAPRPEPTGPTLLDLLPSWELHLQSTNKSVETIRSYLRTIRRLDAWLAAAGLPAGVEDVTTEQLREFLADWLERTSPGTAALHRRNLSVWWNWLEAEEERAIANPMRRVGKIKVSPTAGDVFTDDELRALLATCSGNDFESRRDLAIMRVLMDNGVRLSGLAGIRYTPDDPDTNDVQLARHRLRVRLKGGREIWVPIGRKAAAACDRYIRARKRHRAADSVYLWLPNRALYNRAGECHLTGSGIGQMLDRRGEQAKVDHVYPHKFRRTMATSWEGDSLELMDIGGWESLEMVRHYQRAKREERAHQAHRRLSPGDKI
jgi:site-specific recombinase XerD